MPQACSILAVGAILVAGCSGESFRTAEVTGRVTSKGTAVPGVRVQFSPQRGEGVDRPTAYGLADSDGRYRLKRSGGKFGAVVGSNRVTVAIPEREGGGPPPISPEAAERYAVDVEVKPGQNEHDIDLR